MARFSHPRPATPRRALRRLGRSRKDAPWQQSVIRHTVAAVAGRMPVIAGTGGNATAEAIELTALARDLGVSACLLVTPYYNKPTQEGLYQHFRTIAEAVDIPQILYNVPGRTSRSLLPLKSCA